MCVAISAAGWSHETERYVEVGFDEFVAKPYPFDKVCRCIEKHLDIRFEREAVEPLVADRNRNAPDLATVTLDVGGDKSLPCHGLSVSSSLGT